MSTTLDELAKCIWKKMSEDPNSTTFQAVKEQGISNPLYKCYGCLGHTNVCDGYRTMKELNKYDHLNGLS